MGPSLRFVLSSAFLSLLAVLAPTRAEATCDATPVAVCPDDTALNCEPFDSESCATPARDPLPGTCLADGTPCLGCQYCDFECPTLTCDPVPSPCSLVVESTYRLNGKTCPGCAFCKQCPAPVACPPVDPLCPADAIVHDAFPFETITCPGCARCSLTWECGNGIVEAPEDCDPGADASDDCCTSGCRFEAPTHVCRESTGPCDEADRCTGDTRSCPADAPAPEGTSCGGTDRCSGGAYCERGACAEQPALDCDDGEACTDDVCEAEACVHVALEGCLPEPDGGRIDAGAVDAGPSAADGGDAASDGGLATNSDGGTTSTASGGCGCEASGFPPCTGLVLALRRRRRSR